MTSKLPEPTALREASDFAIGVFGVVALLLLLGGWFWFKHDPLGKKPQTFNVVFKDVDGLLENAAVRINGVRVGSVDTIKLAGANKVAVAVRVSEDVAVTEGSRFEIVTDGLIGSKYLQITLPSTYGTVSLAPLDQRAMVQGVEPAHFEKRLYQVAQNLSSLDFKMLEGELRGNARRLGNAADQASVLARDMQPAVSSAQLAFYDARLAAREAAIAAHRAGLAAKGINSLTGELTGTSRQVRSLMHDPQIRAQFSQITADARAIADRIEGSVRTLDSTLSDEALRKDVLNGLEKARLSTDNIRTAIQSMENISGDMKGNGDLLTIMSDAAKMLKGVNQLLDDTNSHGDLKCTMAKLRDAADRIDQVGLQLNQVLEKRAPALHLLVGRPGHLKHPMPLEPECCPKPQLRASSPNKSLAEKQP